MKPSAMFNKESMAVKASSYQKEGQYNTDEHSEQENPDTQTQYNGVDYFQNGLLDRNITRIYFGSYSDEYGFSGFFTDEYTISKCINENGTFNANKYSQMAQLNTEGDSEHGYKTSFRQSIIAIDIDYQLMDELRLSDCELYNKLVNPDGLSPKGNEIKVAYGKATQNPYQGLDIRQENIESANQYYIEKDTFIEAMEKGVFSVNNHDSFGLNYDKKISIQKPLRQEYEELGKDALSNDRVKSRRAFDILMQPDSYRLRNQLEKQDGRQGAMNRKVRKSKRGWAFEVNAEQINTQRVEGQFICRPDEAYYD